VIICPRLLNERACPQPEGMLRQEVGSGRVMRIADRCTGERPLPPGVIAEAPAHARRACYLDECVPPGRYRYGYARPLECMGIGSQYFAEVAVSEAPALDCKRGGASPQPVPRAPWGPTPWICQRGCMGCAIGERPGVIPGGLVVLGVGLLLLAVRVKRERRSRSGALIGSVLVLGLVLAGCNSSPYFGNGEFHVAELKRSPGMGFCPQIGEATLARLETSAVAVSIKGTIAAVGDRSKDVCHPQYFGTECLIEKPFGPRTLTAAELSSLRGKIAAVPEPKCDVDQNLACDPCVVDQLVIDGREASGFCCGDLDDDFAAAFSQLFGVIDGLARASH
jgi:hypothetical protein